MRLFLLATSLTIFMVSCTSERKVMDSWINSTKKDLVLKWGPPARVASDANGGEIYIYESVSVIRDLSGRSYQRYNHKMFYINSDNKIYSWRTESGPIPAQQLDVNLYVR